LGYLIRYDLFQALLICACVAVGLYVGRKIDAKLNKGQQLDDFFGD
jgi:hypothetical protein